MFYLSYVSSFRSSVITNIREIKYNGKEGEDEWIKIKTIYSYLVRRLIYAATYRGSFVWTIPTLSVNMKDSVLWISYR